MYCSAGIGLGPAPSVTASLLSLTHSTMGAGGQDCFTEEVVAVRDPGEITNIFDAHWQRHAHGAVAEVSGESSAAGLACRILIEGEVQSLKSVQECQLVGRNSAADERQARDSPQTQRQQVHRSLHDAYASRVTRSFVPPKERLLAWEP